MSIDYDRLRELAEKHSPAPWTTVDTYDDGKPRPDTSRLMRDARGEYIGVMHHPDAELAALAPELAREVLELNNELWRLRDEAGHLSALLRREMQQEVADGNNHTASTINAIQWRLEHLLNGDTE